VVLGSLGDASDLLRILLNGGHLRKRAISLGRFGRPAGRSWADEDHQHDEKRRL